MNYNKVEICGVDTSKLVVLKEKEKMELLQKAREGDKEAREKLIAGNLRLVLSVVQKFANRSENLDDLFQVGCIGLIKAIDNFDPSLMLKFSTYGVPMIIGEIRRYLRDNNTIRVSRSMRDTAYKALQVRERLIGEHLDDPTVSQIAQEMGLDRREVVAALEAIAEPISLYEPVYSDGGDTIFVMDQIGDMSGDSDWLDEITFREAIDALAEREKRILSLRFVTGKTQMEVASEVGISQAQVSRLEKGALEKIKKRI
jgi:RNA polymerase sporulation-specific sigma factor